MLWQSAWMPVPNLSVLFLYKSLHVHKLVLTVPHHEYRTRSFSYDLFCRAAEKNMFHARVTMRCNDDEADVFFQCVLVNFVERFSCPYNFSCIHFAGNFFYYKIFQFITAANTQFFFNIRKSDLPETKISRIDCGFNDVEKVNGSFKIFCERQSIFQRIFRMLGEIDGHKNALRTGCTLRARAFLFVWTFFDGMGTPFVSCLKSL